MERKTKDEVADKILEAVIECKYDNDGGDIQTTQVAAKAGISTRTLNRYFPEKSLMLRDAAVKFLNIKYSEYAKIYHELNLEGVNGLDRLILFLRKQKDYYKLDPKSAVLFVDANLICVRIGVEKNVWRLQFGSEIREIVTENLQLGIKDGSIKKSIVPDKAALLISANYNGLMQKLTYTFRSNLSDEEKDIVFEIFEEYIAMLRDYLAA